MDPLLEVRLFDIWVLARREGRAINLDDLARQLPEDRRPAFKQMCLATATYQRLAGVDPTKHRSTPTPIPGPVVPPTSDGVI